MVQLVYSLSVTAVSRRPVRLCRASHRNKMWSFFWPSFRISSPKDLTFNESFKCIHVNITLLLLPTPALGLRNPLAVQGAYPPGTFGLPPPGVNGDLPGAAGYGAGLHLVSPQMNGAAAAAAAAAAAGYGRSPVVSRALHRSCIFPVSLSRVIPQQRNLSKAAKRRIYVKMNILSGKRLNCRFFIKYL